MSGVYYGGGSAHAECFSVDGLARDVEQAANDYILASNLRGYVRSIERLQQEIRPLNLQGNFVFRDIVKDVSHGRWNLASLIEAEHVL